MNLRHQLEILVWGFGEELLSLDSEDQIDSSLEGFSEAVFPVLKDLEEALTGGSEKSSDITLNGIKNLLMKHSGELPVRLRDGSKLHIDPWAERQVKLKTRSRDVQIAWKGLKE